MLGFVIFAIEALLDSANSSTHSQQSPAPVSSGFTLDNNLLGAQQLPSGIPAPSNLASLIANNPPSAFVGGTYNSQVLQVGTVQSGMMQAVAITQQIQNQIEQGKSTITGGLIAPTIRAPSGSTKSFN